MLKAKQKLLDTGYAKCDDYIRQLAEGRLTCLPGCNEEQTLESKILKGNSEFVSFKCILNEEAFRVSRVVGHS